MDSQPVTAVPETHQSARPQCKPCTNMIEEGDTYNRCTHPVCLASYACSCPLRECRVEECRECKEESMQGLSSQCCEPDSCLSACNAQEWRTCTAHTTIDRPQKPTGPGAPIPGHSVSEVLDRRTKNLHSLRLAHHVLLLSGRTGSHQLPQTAKTTATLTEPPTHVMEPPTTATFTRPPVCGTQTLAGCWLLGWCVCVCCVLRTQAGDSAAET